jgi:hypothetical protein
MIASMGILNENETHFEALIPKITVDEEDDVYAHKIQMFDVRNTEEGQF